jgi:ankyrin repeat protein
LESSAKVVELLLSADVDKVALMRQDANGRLPLHNACICGLDGEAPGVVKLLLDADNMKRSITVQDKGGATPLVLSCQFSSGTIVGYLLDASLEADGIEECHFKLADLSNDPLLHRALIREARSSSTGNVLKLIIESDIVKDNIFVQDRRGQIPLHHAVRHGAAKSAFQTLIDADLKGTTFHSPDYLNQTPFDLLVRHVHNGRASAVETLSIIVDADTNRRFFGLEDEKERTPLDKFCKSLEFRKDISHLQQEFLRLLLMATPAGSGDYTGSIPKARSYLGRTKYESIYNDHRMQTTLNNMMWKRSFATHFMLDLYVRILLLFFYSIATNRAVLGLEISKLYFAIVYLCSIYLILWQVQLIGRHELYYLWDGWNLLDLATEILVVISASMLHSGSELEEGVRVLVTLTGGMLWAVIMVSALRSTFLPFAVFVRGFTRVRIMSNQTGWLVLSTLRFTEL